MDKLLRLALWIYLLLFPIRTSNAQPEPVAKKQHGSGMITTVAIWAVILLVAAWIAFMFSGIVIWVGYRTRISVPPPRPF